MCAAVGGVPFRQRHVVLYLWHACTHPVEAGQWLDTYTQARCWPLQSVSLPYTDAPAPYFAALSARGDGPTGVMLGLRNERSQL